MGMEKQDLKYMMIKQKLECLETCPEPLAWDKIYDALHQKPVYLKLNRFNNLTIAISLISLFTFSIFYSPKIASQVSELDALNRQKKDASKNILKHPPHTPKVAPQK